MHKLSQNGLNFIKSWEKFSAIPYLCPAGKLTIGYGHVIKNGEDFKQITEDFACKLLDMDCDIAESCVNKSVRAPLNQNQFDALVSLVFNIGTNALRTSTLLKYLNSEDYECAADQFLVWNKITDVETRRKVVSNGLDKRRKAEREMFLA